MSAQLFLEASKSFEASSAFALQFACRCFASLIALQLKAVETFLSAKSLRGTRKKAFVRGLLKRQAAALRTALHPFKDAESFLTEIDSEEHNGHMQSPREDDTRSLLLSIAANAASRPLSQLERREDRVGDRVEEWHSENVSDAGGCTDSPSEASAVWFRSLLFSLDSQAIERFDLAAFSENFDGCLTSVPENTAVSDAAIFEKSSAKVELDEESSQLQLSPFVVVNLSLPEVLFFIEHHPDALSSSIVAQVKRRRSVGRLCLCVFAKSSLARED